MRWRPFCRLAVFGICGYCRSPQVPETDEISAIDDEQMRHVAQASYEHLQYANCGHPLDFFDLVDLKDEPDSCKEQVGQEALIAKILLEAKGCHVDIDKTSDSSVVTMRVNQAGHCHANVRTMQLLLQQETIPLSHPKFHFMKALISGAIAGVLVDLIMYPLDTIKTRLQIANGFFLAGGFTGLYAGIGSVILGSGPASGLFFLSYEGSKAALNTGMPSHLIASTIAEILTALVRVPFDTVKSLMQVNQNSALSTATAIEQLWKLGGVAAFYKGWWSTIAREVPFGCIQFPLFEFLKTLAASSDRSPHGEISLITSIICGSIAGSLSAAITTPLDVVRTRIILSQVKDISSLRLVSKMLNDEGVSVMFSGIIPRIIWIGLGGAIFLGSYELFSKTVF